MEDDLLTVIFIGIFSLIIIITFIGCLFALMLFYYERKHRRIAYNFVISLCFGDIIHGCLGCAICIRFCVGSKAGDSTCLVQHSILLVASYITLMNVLTTGIDRCWAMFFPLHYHAKMTHKISYGKCVTHKNWKEQINIKIVEFHSSNCPRLDSRNWSWPWHVRYTD